MRKQQAGCTREEETSFSRTLVKGIERFKKAAAAAEGGVLSGKDAFELWDTYGFPPDLTQVTSCTGQLPHIHSLSYSAMVTLGMARCSSWPA